MFTHKTMIHVSNMNYFTFSSFRLGHSPKIISYSCNALINHNLEPCFFFSSTFSQIKLNKHTNGFTNTLRSFPDVLFPIMVHSKSLLKDYPNFSFLLWGINRQRCSGCAASRWAECIRISTTKPEPDPGFPFISDC